MGSVYTIKLVTLVGRKIDIIDKAKISNGFIGQLIEVSNQHRESY